VVKFLSLNLNNKTAGRPSADHPVAFDDPRTMPCRCHPDFAEGESVNASDLHAVAGDTFGCKVMTNFHIGDDGGSTCLGDLHGITDVVLVSVGYEYIVPVLEFRNTDGCNTAPADKRIDKRLKSLSFNGKG